MLYLFLFLPLGMGPVLAQAANSIQWVNPSPGASFSPGVPVEATWTSDRPIQNPTFSWCTTGGQCGPPAQPELIDNEDGTTSVQFPPVEGGQGMYLQMSDKDGGGIHQSPAFSVAPAAAAVKPAVAGVTAVPEFESATSVNPYHWSDGPTPTASASGKYPDTVPTQTNVIYPDPSVAAAMATYGLPSPYPGQQPFANPYAVMNMTTGPLTPTTAADAETTKSNRPNTAVIAAPLSICGVIFLAALMFWLRSRYTRKAKADLEKATSSGPPPPTDWQAVVKRKAMDAMEKGTSPGEGVTVTESRGDSVLPTLGYSRDIDRADRDSRDGRYDDPPRYSRGYGYARSSRGSYSERKMRDMRDKDMDDHDLDTRSRSSVSSRSATRCITPIPAREHSHSHSYEDRYTAGPMLDSSRSRRRCDDYKSSRSRHWDEYDDRHSIKDDYYATSRRSRSGLGGINDREQDRCDCAPRPHSHLLLSAHPSRSRSRDCTDCHRPPSLIPSRHTHSHSHPQTRIPTLDRFDLPGPTYEPMIRTLTTSSTSRGMSERYGENIIPKKQKKKYAYPSMHRDDSSASTTTVAGWDLAGKGAYETSHDRGMGELYESLRRAIGESEIVKPGGGRA